MSYFRLILPPLVLAAGILGVVVLVQTSPEPEKTDEAPRPVALFVEDVRTQPVTLDVETQGEVRPRTEIDLVAQVVGRVTSVADNFVPGGIVAPGETLVQIEPDDYRLAVIRAEADVAAAELKLSREEASAQIVKKQWEWDKLAQDEPTELGLRRPQVAEARANVRAARANLENARLNLKRTSVTVPFAGRIRSKEADIGQFVATGSKLARVFSTEVVDIRLPLTDQQLGQLGLPLAFSAAYGEGPKVDLSATVGNKVRHWTGYIVRTDAAVDSNTRLYYAIAEVRDPYGAAADDGVPLAVGLFVNAAVEGARIEKAHVIPRSALRSDNRVFVVNADDKLEIRHVDVLSSRADRVVVSSGLQAGERVVISPVRAPENGMAVEPRRRNESARIADANAGQEGEGS